MITNDFTEHVFLVNEDRILNDFFYMNFVEFFFTKQIYEYPRVRCNICKKLNTTIDSLD